MLNIKKATVYEETQIKWLWKKFLVRGKFHILGGQPGTAKTTIALDIAAKITNGEPFPDGSTVNKIGHVVIWSDEDAIEDVLKPRLIAANANLDRVLFIDSINFGDDQNRPIEPSSDLKQLHDSFPELPIDLIIFDPITSLIKGDSNKQVDVRNSLRWAIELAEEKSCAILGITHFTKGTAGISPAERITGSVAFSALPRIALATLVMPNSDQKILCIAKSNLGIDKGGFEFTIEQVAISNNITASKIKWGMELKQSAAQIINDLNFREDQRINHNAVDTLRDLLKQGSMASHLIKQIMKKNGFSEKQTRTAKDNLKIIVERKGNQTFWKLLSTE